ncbi:MAG TPA: MarR family transcriptional regulator [Candidatus Desulfobacillus sp.]|nr:MarR family transcriptional regulator [Candidatus Desulfobacillus sp.]
MTRKKKVAGRSKSGDELKFDILPGLVGYQLRLAQLAVFGDLAAEMKDFDISPGRFGVLVLIGANPGMTQSQLAVATQLDRSTMVAVIDHMEARSLVKRRPSPTDRRSNALVLTAEGEKLLRQLKRRIKLHEARIAQVMTREEAGTLMALLGRIREHLHQGGSRQ